MLLSVIILSYALDDEVYQMNCRAIDSLLKSEDWRDDIEILLIESNKEAKYCYDAHVHVIIPDTKFGFHHYLNLGIRNTSGDFIAFCNNDVIFKSGWWSYIYTVKRKYPEFMCFSPLDRAYPMMGYDTFPINKDYYIGWENKKHFAAWCFVWERKVFDIVGFFDETFDFYAADDDELQTLRYYAIPNVVVTHSEVKHLSQVVTKKVDRSRSPVIPIKDRVDYPLTQEELRHGYAWLWDDVRFYYAYQRMKRKWGNVRVRKRVDKIFEKYPRLNVRLITKFLYNKHVNELLRIVMFINK